jgi:hypothetical protein
VRRLLLFIVILVIAVGAWGFISPRLAAKRFRDAVQTGDAAGLNAVVDFPALREHLKADLRNHANPVSARLGTILGGAVNDELINQLVSAAGIIRLARYGTIEASVSPGSGGSQVVLVGMGYRDLANFGVTMGNTRRPAQNMVTFVFHRSGLSWRLAQLDIPSLSK